MADAELDAQVAKFERRLSPRPRAEIEADIEEARTVWVPKVDRFNELVRQRAAIEQELLPLRGEVLGYDKAVADLDWEYFRRLQLDGVVPELPRVTPEAVHIRYTNLRVGESAHADDKNDEDESEEDDGWNDGDFETGSKG